MRLAYSVQLIFIYLIYFRFSPRYGYNAVLMPVCFKLGIPYVMLIGEEEAANDQVTLKDMNQGQQATMAVEDAIAQIH